MPIRRRLLRFIWGLSIILFEGLTRLPPSSRPDYPPWAMTVSISRFAPTAVCPSGVMRSYSRREGREYLEQNAR